MEKTARPAPALVGLDVEIPGPERPRRGWISERASDDQVIVTLYEGREAVTIDPSEILESSLYGPELPVPDGWAAIDIHNEDGTEVLISIRITSREYRFWEEAAEARGQEMGDFLLDSIVAGLERALAEKEESLEQPV
jgi:hypothetical protein